MICTLYCVWVDDFPNWSDYQETPKIYGKKWLPIRIFVQCMLRRSSKSECFLFQKWVKFKPISVKLKIKLCANLIFFQFYCVLKWRIRKNKIISKESIHLFTPKSSLVDWIKMKSQDWIKMKRKTNLPARMWQTWNVFGQKIVWKLLTKIRIQISKSFFMSRH